MQTLSRRRLLGSAALLAALGLAPRALARPASGGRASAYGFGKGRRPGKDGFIFYATLVDLATGRLAATELPFFGHGTAFHPRHPERVVIFEKRGEGCCEVDWKRRKVLRVVPPRAGRHYYGHGAWSSAGDNLFIAETELATQKGLVVVLDARFKELGAFPTYGLNPHDLHLVDGGRVLMIANGGGTSEGEPPSVTFVDVRSHKLLKKLTPTDSKVNMGHVALTRSGDLVAVSAPRLGLPAQGPGGVALRLGEGPLVQMPTSPEVPGMVGEALSICIDEKRRLAAVTHPDGHLLTFWSLDSQKLVGTLQLEHARGVTDAGDGEHFVVSHSQGALALVSWERRQLAGAVPLKVRPFSGSHLYALKV